MIPPRSKTYKITELAASLGMLMIAASLLIPLMTAILDPARLAPYKWIYSVGALVVTVARVVGCREKIGSTRLQRLRRLEFWAGVAFMVGAAFWFYNEGRVAAMNGGILSVITDTITFTLVGGVIQIIAAWMISFREKKEFRNSEEETTAKPKSAKK